jgi:flavin reductase (DIM6/NTAB) family NADH-FMN oxidoreductase RutF
MPIDAKDLRNVMGHFATGVTIVTTHDGNGTDFGLTANAVCSVSLDPPLLLVCVDKTADSYAAFGRSGVFAVNLLTAAQEPLSNRFATSGVDKFAGVTVKRGASGAALLPECLGYLDCRVTAAHDAGDHTIYVGVILMAEAASGDPLLFYRGKYARMQLP